MGDRPEYEIKVWPGLLRVWPDYDLTEAEVLEAARNASVERRPGTRISFEGQTANGRILIGEFEVDDEKGVWWVVFAVER